MLLCRRSFFRPSQQKMWSGWSPTRFTVSMGRVVELARLIYDKTAGNPFFTIQFMSALYEEGATDIRSSQRPSGRGTSIAFTPKLTPTMSWTLWLASCTACHRNAADVAASRLPRQRRRDRDAFDRFREAGGAGARGAVARASSGTGRAPGRALRFIHDRVQEAAYSADPGRIARRGSSSNRAGAGGADTSGKREEAIFEIVNQLNRGAALITQQEERDELAALDLIAGKRAKGSTAYASALSYFNAGAALLAEDGWERRHELIFALEIESGRMRILDGPVIGRGPAIGCAVKSRHNNGRTSHRRVPAHGRLHDARSERRAVAVVSRLPPARRHRVVTLIRRTRRCDANTTALLSLLGGRIIEDLIRLVR